MPTRNTRSAQNDFASSSSSSSSSSSTQKNKRKAPTNAPSINTNRNKTTDYSSSNKNNKNNKKKKTKITEPTDSSSDGELVSKPPRLPSDDESGLTFERLRLSSPNRDDTSKIQEEEEEEEEDETEDTDENQRLADVAALAAACDLQGGGENDNSGEEVEEEAQPIEADKGEEEPQEKSNMGLAGDAARIPVHAAKLAQAVVEGMEGVSAEDVTKEIALYRLNTLEERWCPKDETWIEMLDRIRNLYQAGDGRIDDEIVSERYKQFTDQITEAGLRFSELSMLDKDKPEGEALYKRLLVCQESVWTSKHAVRLLERLHDLNSDRTRQLVTGKSLHDPQYHPLDEGLFDENHKLFVWYLNNCDSNGWRKMGKFVYEPVKTPEGFKTRAYKQKCKITEMVEAEVCPRQHNGEAWLLLRAKGSRRENIADQLEHCHDREFPFLKKDRHVFSWRNGVWHIKAYQGSPEMCGDKRMRRLWKQRFFAFQPEAIQLPDVEKWPERDSVEERKLIKSQGWLTNGRFILISKDGVYLTGYNISLKSPEYYEEEATLNKKKSSDEEGEEKDEDGREDVQMQDTFASLDNYVAEDDEALKDETEQEAGKRQRIWSPAQFYRFFEENDGKDSDVKVHDLRGMHEILDQNKAEQHNADQKRHIYIYENGVYVSADHQRCVEPASRQYRWVGRFYPFRADIEDLAPDITSAKYTDLVFEYQEYERIMEHFGDPMKIPTDAAQQLIDYQFRMDDVEREALIKATQDELVNIVPRKTDAEIEAECIKRLEEKDTEWLDISRFKYSSTMRLCFEVGELDHWEFQTLDKGLAGVGKSTWFRMPQEFYDETDVTIVGNNSEVNFPIQDIWVNKTFMYLMPEVKSDIRLPQTTWQGMVSGEGVQVTLKNMTAVTVFRWPTPGAMAGNDAPLNWNNEQEQVGRRLVTYEHNKTVWLPQTELPKQMTRQKPAFMYKGCIQYFMYIKQYGHKGLWSWISPYFHGTRANLRTESNALEAFLLRGNKLNFGAGLSCSLDDFQDTFNEFCLQKKYPEKRMRANYYNSVFQRRGLKVVTGTYYLNATDPTSVCYGEFIR